MSSWTIAAIGAGQSVSLTFRAIANSSGILYNTASIAGQTEQVCTSIPVKMCAGDEFVLTVPAGRSRYSWYKDGVLIAGQISNTLTVSEPGSYSLGVDTIDGQCPAFSCCPFIVELDPAPIYQAVAIAATCLGNRPQNNGQLVLTNFPRRTPINIHSVLRLTRRLLCRAYPERFWPMAYWQLPSPTRQSLRPTPSGSEIRRVASPT